MKESEKRHMQEFKRFLENRTDNERKESLDNFLNNLDSLYINDYESKDMFEQLAIIRGKPKDHYYED